MKEISMDFTTLSSYFSTINDLILESWVNQLLSDKYLNLHNTDQNVVKILARINYDSYFDDNLELLIDYEILKEYARRKVNQNLT